MKRVALESVLKNTAYFFVGNELGRYFKIDCTNIEKDKNIMVEMRTFQYYQHKAIINSAQKLTLDFLQFIKGNGNKNSESIMFFINNNSANGRDINNLSTKEIDGFLDYYQDSTFMHTQSKADADFYKGYFNTVSDGSVDKALSNSWGKTAFDNELYQKYNNFQCLI